MKNSTPKQRKILKALQEQDPNLSVRWSEERGVAAVVAGGIMTRQQGETPDQLLNRFLRKLGPLFGPANILKNHDFIKVEKRKGRRLRIRAQQRAKGLPIYGATLILFVDNKRGVFRVQSGFHRKVEVPPQTFGAHAVDFSARAAGLAGKLKKRLKADKAGKKFALKKEPQGGMGFASTGAEGPEFPLVAKPKLWLVPTKGGMRQAFRVAAYQPVQWKDATGKKFSSVDVADLVIDARTGRIIEESSRLDMAYSDEAGDGTSTLEDGSGNHLTRQLLVVQDGGGEYLLINRTHTPDIVTHDAGGTDAGLEDKFSDGTHISEDADGHWDDTTDSCGTVARRDSQQPEVDIHFYADQAWEFYHALGWDGFDDGGWGTHCPVRAAAHAGMGNNAWFWRYIDGAGKHWGYLAFLDGSCSAGQIQFDFFGGDPAIFAHEYQHAITYFGAQDSSGDPGYLSTSGWHRALHEGMSDTFAGLRTGQWVTPGLWHEGITQGGQPFRRIEFPRSTDTNNGDFYLDHYDDKNLQTGPYYRSTILSHAAFLAGEGGVHQRVARPAELIPVKSVGRNRVAEIFHHALTEYFDGISANYTGGHTMIDAAQFVLDAAEEITGSQRSCEYVTLRRAFYAVGLFPHDDSYAKQTYGGEACMLPWINDWRLSRPYLGFPDHRWRSPDLFINNGSGAEYDAVIGIENKLFARVRNIGDQDLTDVTVTFYYRAHGTNLPASSTAWKECRDAGGVACVLQIPTLAAGGMNFTDENAPPASQAVSWYLAPAEVVQGLDHFCLRAVIACDAPNHDHDCPNQVQSNVSYSPLQWGQIVRFPFLVANLGRKELPLELEVQSTLPRAFSLKHAGRTAPARMKLKPRTQRKIGYQIVLPARAPRLLAPPYDGQVAAKLGRFPGRDRFRGVLSDARVVKPRQPNPDRNLVSIEGVLSGGMGRRKARINGRFTGELDRKTGALRGHLSGDLYVGRRRPQRDVRMRLEGVLLPLRVVNFTQLVDGEPVGGVTLQLKLPRLGHQLGLEDDE